MSYATWMEDNATIHSNPLRQICLPTSHDSGASALTNPMIGEPGLPADLVKIYNLLPAIASRLANLPRLGRQAEAVVNSVAASIETAVSGLATSTAQSIGDQLQAGVRGLDLRIVRSRGTFYTYHGLNSVALTTVLTDIASFLAATNGEVVYITFGHYEGFEAGSHQEEELLQELTSALGGAAYAPVLDGTAISNDVWSQTWTEIVTANGNSAQASKVILVNGEVGQPSGLFWPRSYSPPDSDDQGMAIDGKYTNGTNVDDMVADQTQNFCQAEAKNLPFALYMTLTPQGSNYTDIIVATIAAGLERLGEELGTEGAPIVGKVVEMIAEDLAVRAPVTTSWTTLEALSHEVGDQLTQLVTSFAPASGEPNTVSMVYIDFFENTQVVDLAIALSTGQLVRTGPSPCS